MMEGVEKKEKPANELERGTSPFVFSRECLGKAMMFAKQREFHNAVAALEQCRSSLDAATTKELGCGEEEKRQLVERIEARLNPLLSKLRSDPYIALSLSRSDSYAQAKTNYRKLALKFHPDKNRGTAELFKCIQESFEKLSPPGLLGGTTCCLAQDTSLRSRKAFHGVEIRNIALRNRTSDSLTLAWTPVQHELLDSYQVLWREVGGSGEWQRPEKQLKRAGLRKTNLKPGTLYEFRLRTMSKSGDWGPFSKPVRYCTLFMTTLGVLDWIHISQQGEQVFLRWTSPKGNITEKRILNELQVKQENDSAWESLVGDQNVGTTHFSYSPTNRTSTTKFTFRVRAHSQNGAGPWSSEKSHIFNNPCNNVNVRRAGMDKS